jgi:nucleotide-binding universal stress UspA family protein
VKFAKENEVDLIVMGSRRLEGVSKIVVALGSVARKVSERAFCPVMLVH